MFGIPGIYRYQILKKGMLMVSIWVQSKKVNLTTILMHEGD